MPGSTSVGPLPSGQTSWHHFPSWSLSHRRHFGPALGARNSFCRCRQVLASPPDTTHLPLLLRECELHPSGTRNSELQGVHSSSAILTEFKGFFFLKVPNPSLDSYFIHNTEDQNQTDEGAEACFIPHSSGKLCFDDNSYSSQKHRRYVMRMIF